MRVMGEDGGFRFLQRILARDHADKVIAMYRTAGEGQGSIASG